jgi:hypothetical protein
MIKVQLSIINNEQMNKINTKFNTWQGYCKYLDEKIDRVDKKIDNVRIELLAKIDEIKEQMVTKEELKHALNPLRNDIVNIKDTLNKILEKLN